MLDISGAGPPCPLSQDGDRAPWAVGCGPWAIRRLTAQAPSLLYYVLRTEVRTYVQHSYDDNSVARSSPICDGVCTSTGARGGVPKGLALQLSRYTTGADEKSGIDMQHSIAPMCLILRSYLTLLRQSVRKT